MSEVIQDVAVADVESEDASSESTSIKVYYELMKPGILRLLLILTFCSMIVAQRGMPDLLNIFWTMLGMWLISGSANALNMVYDRDIDAIMKRTQNRPLPSGRITAKKATIFAISIGVIGFFQMGLTVNWLTAITALGGHLFYVFIYTMWLKRSTPQNIVIGGAAGAVPPLVGWAAVTGEHSLAAWIMFAIIFVWTPPHFWALALYKCGDYTKAKVPMLPVVRGKKATKLQILWYTGLLITVTWGLGYSQSVGVPYLICATILGAGFAYLSIRTAFSEGDKWPKRTFAYSLIYLALLFAAMSLDSALMQPSIDAVPVIEFTPVAPN